MTLDEKSWFLPNFGESNEWWLFLELNVLIGSFWLMEVEELHIYLLIEWFSSLLKEDTEDSLTSYELVKLEFSLIFSIFLHVWTKNKNLLFLNMASFIRKFTFFSFSVMLGGILQYQLSHYVWIKKFVIIH
jgi:hypothetical protein